jgi:glutamate/tyrosine decarboxylase-like PLP-dependent enzyme
MFQELREKGIFEQARSYGSEYLDHVLERHVYPTEEALGNLRHFDHDLPAGTGNASEVLRFLQEHGSPATVTNDGGRYFGFVTGGSVPIGLAAKILGTYWDQNSVLHVLSPVCSKLESVVERWLRDLFHLPESTVAGFVSGTSASNFCALAAARFRVLKNAGWDVNERGLFGAPKVRVVLGKGAHSTVIKALGLLGFGRESFEWVEVDDQARMIPEKVPVLDASSILILQAGNVNSGSFDPFAEICTKAKAAGAWVHIDGAFGLWAAASPELSHLTKGIERGDSWAVDGHKTLNTPYDNGIVLCRDREALASALHMTGSYIVVSDTQRDGMFYTPEMSRRGRVIELWATLNYLGKEGVDQLVTGLHRRAVQFSEELRNIEGFHVLNDVVFNQVLVRCDSDDLTQRTLERIQQLRECWVGGSSWHGRKVIRISVCSWATTQADITRSVRSFRQALEEVQR